MPFSGYWRGALRKPSLRDPRPWDWSIAGKAVLFVLLYAASDEFHQLFVPNRQASLVDVIIDTTGGAGGLLVLWIVGNWLNWWRRRKPAS